ncbi:hypothetical protein GQF61_15905 [Sphingobacterium sp. DK4209]|uniref:Fibrobacter succinogenes major paralogous domain-containing protein n=1 Tax=Sphingobacterium zhuxiongii TaxID=2662364 RepID=A0A5Q0QGA7_9SPHI|nr:MULTISPECIES: FISUMP domain-containing protein [unclassified Sphingobacterium]MVZ67340.1 hypothetical protein [Sphingobacterium sp. DK4209]QGA26928.1 hypothetical protein GFH32_11650 [Sphingobacterium sp. dk4302]
METINLRNFLILFLAVPLMLFSCTSKQDALDNQQTELSILRMESNVYESTAVVFSGGALRASEVSNPSLVNRGLSQSLVAAHSELLSVASEREALGSAKQLQGSLGEKKSEIIKTYSSLIKLENGVAYRMLLYRVVNNSERFDQAVDLVSGVSTTISLSQGVHYRWYAYSFNSPEVLPTVLDMNNPSVNSRFDQPLLYTSGNFTAVAGEQALDLVFKHELAKVQIDLDVRGLNADIVSVTAKFASSYVVQTGSFDLKRGTMGAAQNRLELQQLPLSFTKDKDQTKGRLQVAYYHAFPNTSHAAFTINLTELTVKYESGGSRQLINNSTSKTVDFCGYSPAIGRTSLATINFLEGGFTIAGVTWSKANLYYDGSSASYKFREDCSYNYFRNLNSYGLLEYPDKFTQNYAASDYWYWMSLLPNQRRSNWLSTGDDPCKLVKPEGVWRLPTDADFGNLANQANTTEELGYDVIGDASTRYVKYKNKSNTNFLKLKFDGKYNSSLSALEMPNYLYLWTSSKTSKTNGEVAIYFRHDFGTNNGYTSTVADNLNYRQYNIRCVR